MSRNQVQFTIGQVGMIAFFLVSLSFFSFYLGARFGPELFWDIPINELSQKTLLPSEVLDSEVQALLAEEGDAPLTFHESLKTGGTAKVENLEPLKEDPLPPPPEPEPAPLVEETKEEPVKVAALPEKAPVEKIPVKETLPPVAKVEPKPEPKVAPKVEAKPAPKTEVKAVAKIEPKKETVKPAEPKKVAVVVPPPKPAPKIEPKIEPAPTPPPPALPPEAVVEEPATPPPPARYTLQVGSFSSMKEATALQEKLASGGYSANVQTLELPGKGKWYRVKAGRFPDQSTAQSEKGKIERQYGVVPVITQL